MFFSKTQEGSTSTQVVGVPIVNLPTPCTIHRPAFNPRDTGLPINRKLESLAHSACFPSTQIVAHTQFSVICKITRPYRRSSRMFPLFSCLWASRCFVQSFPLFLMCFLAFSHSSVSLPCSSPSSCPFPDVSHPCQVINSFSSANYRPCFSHMSPPWSSAALTPCALAPCAVAPRTSQALAEAGRGPMQ